MVFPVVWYKACRNVNSLHRSFLFPGFILKTSKKLGSENGCRLQEFAETGPWSSSLLLQCLSSFFISMVFWGRFLIFETLRHPQNTPPKKFQVFLCKKTLVTLLSLLGSQPWQSECWELWTQWICVICWFHQQPTTWAYCPKYSLLGTNTSSTKQPFFYVRICFNESNWNHQPFIPMDGYFRVPGCSDMFLQLWEFLTALDSDQGQKTGAKTCTQKASDLLIRLCLSTLVLICSSFSRKFIVIRCLFVSKAQVCSWWLSHPFEKSLVSMGVFSKQGWPQISKTTQYFILFKLKLHDSCRWKNQFHLKPPNVQMKCGSLLKLCQTLPPSNISINENNISTWKM